MSHKCHAHGCSRDVPPRFLFCAPHWHATRKTLQNAIWNEYRVGQEERAEGFRSQVSGLSSEGSGSEPKPEARSPRPSNRYLAIQRLCVSELAYRPAGGVPASVGVAHAYGEQAEHFRQKAIAAGEGDPFEQLERRKKRNEGQLELGLFEGGEVP